MTKLTDDEILRMARAIEQRRADTKALNDFIRAREEKGADVRIQVGDSSTRRAEYSLYLPDDIVDDVIRKLQRLEVRKRFSVPGVTDGD